MSFDLDDAEIRTLVANDAIDTLISAYKHACKERDDAFRDRDREVLAADVACQEAEERGYKRGLADACRSFNAPTGKDPF